MVATLLILLAVGLIVAGILGYPIYRQQRRDRLKRRSFPSHWQAIVAQTLPIYANLTLAERERLHGHIQVFLAEKQFIGCQGVQVTLAMKLTIAAMGCLLLLNERSGYFPKLRSILVYPHAYRVQETTTTGNHIVESTPVVRLGESWSADQIVLSWEHVQYSSQNWGKGHNVVLHELAHQLDQEDGTADGVPILRQKADYSTWATVMTDAYQQLRRDVQQGRRTVIDAYGATNPAEFFAVATETFFTRPAPLLRQHPALYAQLQRYYQLNPMAWTPSAQL